MLALSISQTDGGPVLTARIGDRVTALHASTALTDHRIIGGPLQALSEGCDATGEISQARAADLTPSGFNKMARDLIAARIAGPFNVLRDAIIVAETDLAARRAPYEKPFFAADHPPAVRVELRQHARSLPLPALMEAVQSDPTLAAAVIEGGLAMSGLPADIFARVERDMAVGNATRVLAGQRTYKTAPSASDPVGGKPDPKAARAAGEGLIAAFEMEEALLATAPAFLAAVVDFAALLTDTTRDEAFRLLTA